MQTKYLVILLVIVVIGSGLYFFQKNRQKKALLAHNIEQLQRTTKAAKKSSATGLLVMASAINKFHNVKGHYPGNLLELYPEFIPEKSFIVKLRWKYHTEKNSYLLQKNVKEGSMLASMGPDLRLRTGTDVSLIPQKAIASVDKTKTQKARTKPTQQPDKVAVIPKAPSKKPDLEKDTEKNQLAMLSPGKLLKTSGGMNLKKRKKLSIADPLDSIVIKELDQDEKFLLSLEGTGFYIWKSNDGSIGFSNIKYPDEKDLAVYKNQTWVEYIKKPSIQSKKIFDNKS